MKNTCVLMLVLTVLLMGSHSFAVSQEKGFKVSVMSFNIRYATKEDGNNQWDNRRELVIDVIRTESPDVMGLQEALRVQLDDLRKALPKYGEIGVGRNGGKKGEYNAILYRTDKFSVAESGTFWLSNTPSKPSSHWGNKPARLCTWARFINKNSNGTFYVYNTHFDHQSQPSREKSARLIVSRIQQREHQDPFVLTGDFNASEDNPAIQYLKGTISGENNPVPLADAFRIRHPKAKEAGTFNGFTGRSRGSKIDYVFVEKSTRVRKADIIRTNKDGRYPSDHFPVTATVQFNQSTREKRIR